MVTEGARDRYQIINSTSVIFKVKVQDFKLILQLQLQPSWTVLPVEDIIIIRENRYCPLLYKLP